MSAAASTTIIEVIKALGKYVLAGLLKALHYIKIGRGIEQKKQLERENKQLESEIELNEEYQKIDQRERSYRFSGRDGLIERMRDVSGIEPASKDASDSMSSDT